MQPPLDREDLTSIGDQIYLLLRTMAISYNFHPLDYYTTADVILVTDTRLQLLKTWLCSQGRTRKSDDPMVCKQSLDQVFAGKTSGIARDIESRRLGAPREGFGPSYKVIIHRPGNDQEAIQEL